MDWLPLLGFYIGFFPTMFTDPSGHCLAEGASGRGKCTPVTPVCPFSSPLLNFSGQGWTTSEKQKAHQAASTLGNRMASAVNPLRRLESRLEGATYTPLSGEDAFLGVFGGPVTLHKTDQECTVAPDCVAWVGFDGTSINMKALTNPYLLIHEIFHILDLTILGGIANQALTGIQKGNSSFPNRPDLNGDSRETWGFAGGNFSNWQKSRLGLAAEEFADMGIGWTYNRWAPSGTGVGWSPQGAARANFMDVNMGPWLLKLLP